MDIENLKAKWEERIRRIGGSYGKQNVVFIHAISANDGR